MATNVSERDKKVLRELIEWLGKERDYVLRAEGGGRFKTAADRRAVRTET